MKGHTIMNRRVLPWIMASALAVAVTGCKVEQTEPGKMPEVNVTPGKMPEFDVKTADIDVHKTTTTVTVPEVDVKTEKKTISVPDVDVKMPK